MVETKTLEATSKAWEQSHSRVASAYVEGISAARDVIAKAIAGEANYAAGVQEAIASGRRAKALDQVSHEQWRKAAREKGGPRIAPAIAAAKDSFRSGMGEVLSTIQAVSLPARTTDAATNVANRVTPIAVALQNMARR